LSPALTAKIESSYRLATSEKTKNPVTIWAVVHRVPPDVMVRLATALHPGDNWLVHSLVALPTEMLVLPTATRKTSYTKVGDAWRPLPSQFYQGIDARLDLPILRAGRHHDVELLAELAQVPRASQPTWWERATTQGIAYARRLAPVPGWAAHFIDGDAEAQRIWAALTCLVQSLTYRPHADAKMAGTQVQWIGGLQFNGDATRDRRRLAYRAVGSALEHGNAMAADFALGAVAPWKRW
jgi:hypothetical protein